MRRSGCQAVLLALLIWAPPLCRTQALDVHHQQAQRSRHLSPKDDVEAIGSRNIGKTGAGNWYSLEREQRLGREYAKAIENRTKFTNDHLVTEYVNNVSQNIVRNSDAQVPFRVKVIDSDEINAFALPGGYLYVNTGLILAAQDESELAGVIAHEIAHVAARHATRQMTRSSMFDFASIPLILVGGPLGTVLQSTIRVAKPLSLTNFSRSFEAEADYLGVQYLYKAGYDPQALISFFERIRAMEHSQPGAIAKAFSTHPQTSDRVRKLQKELVKILPARGAYVVSTSDFDQVVSHLLQSGRMVRSLKPPRPTLRRRIPKDDTSVSERPETPIASP